MARMNNDNKLDGRKADRPRSLYNEGGISPLRALFAPCTIKSTSASTSCVNATELVKDYLTRPNQCLQVVFGKPRLVVFEKDKGALPVLLQIHRAGH